MAPAHTAPSSSLLQILQSTVGDEALDLTAKAMKRLSEYENFRYHPESGRLEVLVPLADEDLWVRRRTVQTLSDFLEDDEQYAISEVPGEEYTFWLAQCVHYGLEFPTTTEDAKRYVRVAIEQGIKKEPSHFRILWKFLKRQYLEMYEESEESEVDDDDQVVFVGPEEEESGFDMADDDCQVVEGLPADEESDTIMTDEEHDADDEDESDDTEPEDDPDADSESDDSDNNSDADMDDDGEDDADNTQDGDDQEDQEIRGVSGGVPADINMNANEDGASGQGEKATTPDHQQSEYPAPQSAAELQVTFPSSTAAAIEEVDLSQESPTSIYDLSSDSDLVLAHSSNNPGQDNTEEASYDAALRQHIEFLYNEDEYENFSEYDAGSIATDSNDLRPSSRATRSSAAKDGSMTSSGHVAVPPRSPACFIDLDNDLETAESCQNVERHKSQDLPGVGDLLPSTTHNKKSATAETPDSPGSNTHTVEDRTFLHVSIDRSQDSVLESIDTCLPNPGIPQIRRLTEGEDVGKSHIEDTEGATAFYPLPSATSLSSSYSKLDHDHTDSRALPLKTRSASGNVTGFINVPQGPKAWSSPCESKLGSLSGVTAHSHLLTPSPRESRFLRQSMFQKAKGAVFQGEHGTSMLDSFSSVTAQSTILSTPFVRSVTFPIQPFAHQTVQNKLELAAGMNAEQSDQAREHEKIVNWHRQEYQRLREVNHQKIRKGQPGADAFIEHGQTQESTSRAGKTRAENNISPSSIGNHSQITHQRSKTQRSVGNAVDHTRKRQCFKTPSKSLKPSRGRWRAHSSRTGKATSLRSTNSAIQSAVGGCSTQERFPKKEGSFKRPTTNTSARRIEKQETRAKQWNRGGRTPTKTTAFKVAAAKAKSEVSFPSIRYDANQTPKSESIKATNNLNGQIIDLRDATFKRDKDKKTSSNDENLISQATSSKPELAWESITYTSNPMAGRRPGSYRLDSLEPQHFRDVITIVNPVARPGQSLKDLPPPRQIPMLDQGTEPPLELQWVEQRRAFKKRKLDEFMANVPVDSLLKDRVPTMVSEPKGLRIEYF